MNAGEIQPPAGPLHKVVGIRVVRLWESCDRTTFVELVTDEGMTMTPQSFRTGSERPKIEGISVEEARDRALNTADTWGDFLGIVPEPFEHDGVVHEPHMTMRPYETRRILAARKAARNAAAQ